MMKHFKSSLDLLFYSFPSKYFVRLLSLPIDIYHFRNWYPKQLFPRFLKNAPVELLLTLGNLSSVKQALFVAFSRKCPDRSNNNSSLGMKLWKPSNLILISLVTARLPLCFQAIGFHGYCRSWEKVMEIEQVRTLESSLFFPRLSNFSLINIPWIVERL